MFGFLKKLVGGLFGFLGGLFKSKKGDFYLELDEAKTVGTTPKTESTAESIPAPAPAKATKAKAPEKAVAPVVQPQPKVEAPQPVGTFAPQFLLYTQTQGKRVPGPSLDPFRNIARQIAK